MTELDLVIEQLPDHGAALIRVAGPLTAWNRHDLRRAVFKALTDIPAAIILDLTGSHLVDRIAGGTFLALRREAARTGPGVGLLLCGVQDQLLLQRLRTLDRTQPVYPTLADALVGIADGPGVERWLYHPLPPGLLAPIDAGVAIATACTQWGLTHLAFPARSAVFALYMVARRCPSGRMALTASYDAAHLLVGFRTVTDLDDDGGCARLRPPPGYHHRAGRTGHIVWTALSTRPPVN